MPNFSGKWNLDGQLRGVKQGTWTGIGGPALYAWGTNAYGTLGIDGTTKSSPVQVGELTNWSEIASGTAHALAVQSDGTLWSWGRQGYFGAGCLGHNDSVDRSSPTQVGALTTWALPSAGQDHSLATTTSNELYAWGDNNLGKLGLGNVVNRSSPVQVGSLTNWDILECGTNHTVVIKTDGTLWAWGVAAGGQLGNNSAIARSSPIQVGADTDWSKISSANHNLALKTSGELYAWGFNSSGVLGFNDTVNKSSPVQLGAGTYWSDVSAGPNHSLAVKTDGTLWAWGNDGNGRLGLNQPDTDKSSPVQVGALTNWSQVSAGTSFSLAIKTNGTIWSWGNGSNGATGHNDGVARSSPVQVGNLTSWIKASAGQSQLFSLALKDERTGMS